MSTTKPKNNQTNHNAKIIKLSTKTMKKVLLIVTMLVLTSTSYLFAQKVDAKTVPLAVRSELTRRYPDANKATWEKHKGNYRAYWSGKTGHDKHVDITPGSAFLEIGDHFDPKYLPKAAISYIDVHYHTPIINAEQIADVTGNIQFLVRISGDRELLFTTQGRFMKQR